MGATQTSTELSVSCLFKVVFLESLKVLFTFCGIGRGGEIKFLNYRTRFFCETFNVSFVQWFQRKNLKTNPSGFAVDSDNMETCIFLLLGLHWSQCNGLLQENVVGEPNTPLARKSGFVFQQLHWVQDATVAGQATSIIKGCVPEKI